MKFSIVIIALILTVSSCNVQSKEQQNNIDKPMDLSFIDNKSIEYGFVRRLDTTVAPFIHYPGLFVNVELTNEQYEIVRKFDKRTWLNLLNSPDSDFAANLILYSIYDKDIIISYWEDNLCEVWKKYDKDEDLDYWEQYLDEVQQIMQ